MSFTPQRYAPLYVSINDTPQTEVQSVDVNQISGSQDVKTIMREWAGVVKGAGMTDCTLTSVLPYIDTDTGGVGFNTGGNTAAGVQLGATMITSLNLNLNAPVKFIIMDGAPSVQQYVFSGFVMDIKTSYSVDKEVVVTMNVHGQLQLWA